MEERVAAIPATEALQVPTAEAAALEVGLLVAGVQEVEALDPARGAEVPVQEARLLTRSKYMRQAEPNQSDTRGTDEAHPQERIDFSRLRGSGSKFFLGKT